MISIKAVFSCISKALNVNVKKISINSSSKDFENWDSLAQLSILTMLDNKLDGKIFTMKEMATAYSVKKIVKLLKKNNFLKKN